MALIELKNLCKSYWVGEMKLDILKHISLTIEAGEFVAIIRKVDDDEYSRLFRQTDLGKILS